ncbi:hypothetical protein HMPREF0262_00159 [Clostridium sp. ATCC 29733]|nr:hypothetical protein HMPREF0262_00159 [Clostridium sp. ATCC 29733]
MLPSRSFRFPACGRAFFQCSRTALFKIGQLSAFWQKGALPFFRGSAPR